MPAPHHTSRRSETGFSLVELIVAMAIISILGAIAVLMFRGTHANAVDRSAKASAAAYDTALSSYLADHGHEFPAAFAMPPEGPVNLVNRPYMGSAPDAVTSGSVGFAGNCGAPTGDSQAFISICKNTPAKGQYDVQVFSRASADDPWPASPTCHRGPAAVAPSC